MQLAAVVVQMPRYRGTYHSLYCLLDIPLKFPVSGAVCRKRDITLTVQKIRKNSRITPSQFTSEAKCELLVCFFAKARKRYQF